MGSFKEINVKASRSTESLLTNYYLKDGKIKKLKKLKKKLGEGERSRKRKKKRG